MYIRKYDLGNIVHAKHVKVKPPLTWFTIVATWFFIGLIPIASGTFGSIAVYPLFWLVLNNSSNIEEAQYAFTALAVVVFLLGTWATSKYEKVTKTHDHATVVIDEVLGMLLAFAICFEYAYDLAKMLDLFDLKPKNGAFLIVLIVFRYFDIAKPFYIRSIDRYIRNSFGVMLDDALAGFYTAVTIIVATKLYILIESNV